MTKQASIAYISDLLEHPARITEADQSSIAGFRQSFPYFVPARYLEAYHKHKESPWAPTMLSGVMPFAGNWILFCEFLSSGYGNYGQNKREKNKKTEPAERPILKAKTVTVEQKEPEPLPEEVVNEPVAAITELMAEISAVAEEVTEPTVEAAEAVQEQFAAIEVEETLTEEVVALPAPVEEVRVLAEEMAEIEMPVVATAAEEITERAEEIVPVPEEKAEEVAKDIAIAPTEVQVIAVAETENTLAAEALKTEVAGETPAAEKEIAVAHEAEITLPEVPMNEINKEELEELEQRHNDFWTQAEEETAPVAAKEERNGIKEAVAKMAPTEEKIEKIEEADEWTSYVPTGNEKPLIYPMYTEDYFLTQGEKVRNEMPEDEDIESLRAKDEATSLMVMMSFSEWLLHFKSTTEKQKEETKDQKALKTMWQKEKLAAAIEEENEEIPENVFEMAVNSITKEDGLASEALADIYVKQGKYDKAVDMFRKLSLRNPQKNAYFARKIEDILKEKKS